MSESADTAEPEVAWVDYGIEHAGLRLSAPGDWSAVAGAEGDIALFTAPHPSDAPFVSNLTVVTRERAAADTPEHDLVTEQSRALLTLDDALLLDSEPALVGGRPGARALVAYYNGEYELTLEQWVVAAGTRIVVISATVLTRDYAYDAELYDAVVMSAVFDG